MVGWDWVGMLECRRLRYDAGLETEIYTLSVKAELQKTISFL
jgi:hypothetical protein